MKTTPSVKGNYGHWILFEHVTESDASLRQRAVEEGARLLKEVLKGLRRAQRPRWKGRLQVQVDHVLIDQDGVGNRIVLSHYDMTLAND